MYSFLYSGPLENNCDLSRLTKLLRLPISVYKNGDIILSSTDTGVSSGILTSSLLCETGVLSQTSQKNLALRKKSFRSG